MAIEVLVHTPEGVLARQIKKRPGPGSRLAKIELDNADEILARYVHSLERFDNVEPYGWQGRTRRQHQEENILNLYRRLEKLDCRLIGRAYYTQGGYWRAQARYPNGRIRPWYCHHNGSWRTGP